MAKLLHFTKKDPTAHGPSEFVYICEDDEVATVKEYDSNGYLLAGTMELNDDELGGFPTERELSP